MTDTEPSNADTSNRPEVNLPKLLELCGGILTRVFFESPKDKSKQLFKDIKKGSTPTLGNLKLGTQMKVDLVISMDYSQYVGPGFNFDVFHVSLRELLKNIAGALRGRQDLDIRTSEQGGVLIGRTGVVQVGEHVNVMMLVLETGTPGQVRMNLIYMDPEQFRRTDQSAESPET